MNIKFMLMVLLSHLHSSQRATGYRCFPAKLCLLFQQCANTGDFVGCSTRNKN